MKDQNNDKIKRTMEFYDKYPLASGNFRKGASVLKMEDIQVDLLELENKLILDCGCGPGNVSMKILESVNNSLLISMDLSLNSLKIFKKRLINHKLKSDSIQILCNVLSLPFKKNSYDFIIASGVVHHTPDPFKSLDNLFELLKKDGRMYFSLYNKKSFYFPEFFTIGTLFRFFYKNKMGRFQKISLNVFKFILSKINGDLISDDDARKIFADRYLTPVASFHTFSQIKKWSKKNNVCILKSGNCKFDTLIWFLVKKDNV